MWSCGVVELLIVVDLIVFTILLILTILIDGEQIEREREVKEVDSALAGLISDHAGAFFGFRRDRKR